MNKSILVIDTPKNCADCPLFYNVYTDMTCGGNGRTIDYPFPSIMIQDWCPLLELPQKMAEENRWFSEDYVKGRNACIDEILKGVNEDE